MLHAAVHFSVTMLSRTRRTRASDIDIGSRNIRMSEKKVVSNG